MKEIIPHIKDVPAEFRVNGYNYSYNAGCTYCIKCESNLSAITTLIGFAEYNNGLMQIHECKDCFKKQRFHVRSLSFLNTLILLLER
jgi:hypothetical protein